MKLTCCTLQVKPSKMIWPVFIRVAPNFAGCFHVGIFSHVIGIYSMFYYPQRMKIEEGNYEYMIRDNLFIFWLFSMLTFCAAFGIKTYHNIHDGRHNWKPRHEKLKDLKIGTIGFLACSIVYVVCGYMENGSCAGYIVLALAHLASSIFLGFYIMQQSYMCKIPENLTIWQIRITALAMMAECLFWWCGQIAITQQWIYFNVVACFLNYAYILFTHSSEVYFLEDFLGKRILCTDACFGNEYKGHFVSTGNENCRHMDLKLKHVEKMIGGEFVKQSEDVTVGEVSSLKLADDQPSTLTASSSANTLLKEFSKKRAVCMDTEANECRGDLALLSVDLEDGDKLSFVKLRNGEKV